MREKSLRLSLIAGAAVAIAAGALATAKADMMTSVGQGEGEVAIVAWAGYIERGETDKNYDWVTGFEKQTGCKVTVKVAATSDEMVSLMTAGGFDLVTASGDASLRLVAGKRVQPINTDLVPSWKTVDDRLRAGLHKGDTIFPHLGEFLYIRDVALQPPLGEHLPAHIGAAFEAGGKLVAGRRGMVNNRILRQVQALPSRHVHIGVGTGCLT